MGQGSSELGIPPQLSQSKSRTSRQTLDEMEAEDKALCAQVAREKGFATYEDLSEAEFENFGETLKARLKRRREDAEQMGEDAPKRKVARRHRHSSEPWYHPKRCRCTSICSDTPFLAGIAKHDYRSYDARFLRSKLEDTTRINDGVFRGMG